MGVEFQIRKFPEVQQVLRLSEERGIIVREDDEYKSNVLTGVTKDPSVPFVVIEGLDGSGKLGKFVSEALIGQIDIRSEYFSCR